MSQATFKRRNIAIVCLIVVVLLVTARVSARDSGSPLAQAVVVQDQPAKASLHLEATFAKNVLIGTVTSFDKDGRPLSDVRGQAHLLDSAGQRLAILPLQPLGPGEFRLIAPLGQLKGPGYLDVRLPGRGKAGEQRGVYEVNPASRTVTWVKTAPGGPGDFSVQATGGPDAFGYTWDDTTSYDPSINASGGISVSLRGDDDWTGPFSIGFTFNFYGQNYTQFYVDSNGYIGFDTTQTRSYYANSRLPFLGRPNNIVAPFWDDFDPSKGGTVRYRTFGSPGSQYLVVEWSGVPLWGTSYAQSFQVILYESKNIKFQYPATRQGTGGDLRYATTGIENSDGTIGLEYPSIIPITTTRAIQINYNRPTYNVFLTPDQQGGSAAAGSSVAFHVSVRNLGANADSYTMSRSAYTGSDWAVSFYQSDGVTPLGSSTGSIAAGAQKDIVVKVSVPGGASIGNWTRATIQATSQASGAVQDTATVDAVLTPSFYQMYSDDDSGDGTDDAEIYVDPVVSGAGYTKRLTTDQDNSAYPVTASTPDGNAVIAWNTSYWNGTASVSEIQYAVADRSGSFVRSITRLTNNSAATLKTWDWSPTVAAAPNGNILIGWSQQVDTSGDGLMDRFNARYTIVNSGGGVVKAPAALMTNTTDFPRDYPPSVVALTGTNNFLLTWEHGISSGVSDIYYTVLDSSGNVVRGATQLTSGGNNYLPRAAAFPNGKAAIVWTSYNGYDNGEIYYAVLNADGSSPSPLTPITANGSSASSTYADAAALSDGQLAVAWTQYTVSGSQIQYTIVSPSGQAPVASFTSSSPDTSGETTVFTNTTTGTEPISYQWSFGDGGTSTLKNPTHAYAAVGTYSVWLTATNASGTSVTSGTVQITPSSCWTTIVSEDFESSFPGTTWQVFDNDGATNGEYYWAKKNCRPYAGSYSGWAVGGGANGAALSCGATYPISASSWMTYGPFSLVGATAADLKFTLWLSSELNYDGVCQMASINGIDFSGSCTTGNTQGWIDRVLDLTSAGSLGNLMGQSNVWIALIFVSDGSITYPEGAYVDNIVLRKCTSGTPVAGFTSSSPDMLGETTIFTNTTMGTEPISYQWSLGDGGTSTLKNPTHPYAAAGTYSVWLTATNASGTSAVNGTVQTMPSVVPPLAGFTSSSPDTLGETTTFNNTTTGTEPISYQWSFGDGVTSTFKNPTYTYIVTGTFTVWLTATNASGTSVVSGTVQITPPVPPTAGFTSSSPDTLGETTFFTNTTTGTEPISYEWSFGDGGTSTFKNPTYTYIVTGTFTVWLTATNAAGTSVVTSVVSGTVEITPPIPPTAGFTSSSPDALSETTVFTNTTTGTEPISYQWSFGDGGTSTFKNPTHAYIVTGTFTVWLTATNAAGTSVASGTVQITPPQSQGINGRVTYQGSPIAGINLVLRFYNGSSWSTVLTTTTQADGTYRFTSAPSLESGQRYYVGYNNGADGNTDSQNYLGAWRSFDITSYTAGTSVSGGDFDIANIVLSSPNGGVTVPLPQMFSWVRRAATTSDSYEWDVFDPTDMNPWAYTSPLGYVSSFTLTFLPSGFSYGVQYGWNVWAIGPDGGTGPSYYFRYITFSSVAANSLEGVRRDWPVNKLDLDKLIELHKARSPASVAQNSQSAEAILNKFLSPLVGLARSNFGQTPKVSSPDTQRAPSTQRTPSAHTADSIQHPAAPQVIYTVPNALSSANIYVSLAIDSSDRLIMTWLDNAYGYYLFYALASNTGASLTPAVILQRTRHSYLWSSWNGYGNDRMPPKTQGPTGPIKVYLPLLIKNYPPPPIEVPINGGFETGSLSGWTAGSNTTNPSDPAPIPQAVTSQHHSGNYAAVLGRENDPCVAEVSVSGLTRQSWIYQDINVPSSGSPRLTLYYRIFTYDKPNADKYDRFEVYINGTLLSRFGEHTGNYGCSAVNDLGWRSYVADLSAYRGQTVRLQLANIMDPDHSYSTWTYVDDISVTQ